MKVQVLVLFVSHVAGSQLSCCNLLTNMQGVFCEMWRRMTEDMKVKWKLKFFLEERMIIEKIKARGKKRKWERR